MSYRAWTLLLIVLQFAVFFWCMYKINSTDESDILGGVLAGINLFFGFYNLGRLISNWSEWK
jgi:hypothetical protein